METTKCKKCGQQHRIDNYRSLKYYICDVVNRVLLLTEEKKDGEQTRTNWIDSEDTGHSL